MQNQSPTRHKDHPQGSSVAGNASTQFGGTHRVVKYTTLGSVIANSNFAPLTTRKIPTLDWLSLFIATGEFTLCGWLWFLIFRTIF